MRVSREKLLLTQLNVNCPPSCATLISFPALVTLATCSHFFFALAMAISFFLSLFVATSEDYLGLRQVNETWVVC